MQEILNLSSILDYGILGVLVVVLYLVGKYVKSVVDKLMAFMQEQAHGAVINQQAQSAAWKQLVQDNITNQVEIAESIKIQLKTMERMIKQNSEAHAIIMKSIKSANDTFVRWHEQAAGERKLMLEALKEALDQAKDVRINGR